MYRALAYKELREVGGIAAAALLAYLAIVSTMTGAKIVFVSDLLRPQPIPFLGGAFTTALFFVAGVLTIAMGLRQSAWEDVRGTFLLLLHRPLPRTAIVLTKLTVGIALYLLCTALPIVLYGWWATIPGNKPSPFEWSMTDTCVRVCVSMPIVYLGAFLSGMRPARWYATRLLPLLAAIVLTAAIQQIPLWWICGLPLALLTMLLLGGAVCWTAHCRDF